MVACGLLILLGGGLPECIFLSKLAKLSSSFCPSCSRLAKSESVTKWCIQACNNVPNSTSSHFTTPASYQVPKVCSSARCLALKHLTDQLLQWVVMSSDIQSHPLLQVYCRQSAKHNHSRHLPWVSFLVCLVTIYATLLSSTSAKILAERNKCCYRIP